MRGPWPMKAAIYSRPSAVSLKVWLHKITFTITFWSFSFGGMDFQWRDRNLSEVSLKYRHLCFKDKRKSYGFRMMWRWVNDDKIVIFGWTIFINNIQHCLKTCVFKDKTIKLMICLFLYSWKGMVAYGVVMVTIGAFIFGQTTTNAIYQDIINHASSP